MSYTYEEIKKIVVFEREKLISEFLKDLNTYDRHNSGRWVDQLRHKWERRRNE